MKYRTILFAVALAAGLPGAAAIAGQRSDSQQESQHESPRGRQRDSQRAFDATREGRSMPLPKLEQRVLPFMGGADYLGPELNGGIYRFKFIQNGRVIWVDVDARSGRIIRRSRPR